MSIPSHLIELARESNILNIAQQRGATLKRVTSTEWAGPCPVCNGRDRFAISTSKRVFNCRGCGAPATSSRSSYTSTAATSERRSKACREGHRRPPAPAETGGSTDSGGHDRDRPASPHARQ